jgi:hypothetical protein
MARRSIAEEVAAKRCAPEEVLRFLEPDMDVIVGAANVARELDCRANPAFDRRRPPELPPAAEG